MKTIINPNQTNNNKLYYSDALQMIAEYKSEHGNDPDFLASEFFDVESLKRIMGNPKCKGVRIFNAIKTDNGKKQNRLIIVGVDESGKAILNYKIQLSSVSVASIGNSILMESIPLENGSPCPPFCVPVAGQ